MSDATPRPHPPGPSAVLAAAATPLVRGAGAWQQAKDIARAAAARGFDWPALDPILAKTAEELAEVREAHRDWQQADGSRAKAAAQALLEAECGDLLFAALNVCRIAGVVPEAALAACNQKFVARFAAMEAHGLPEGRTEDSLAHWQRLWQQAKLAERHPPPQAHARKM